MPLPNHHSIKTKIVLLFEKYPQLKAKTLHQLLIQSKMDCSLQAVYKELKHLLNEGIIRKNAQFYSLDTTWVVQLHEFAENLMNNYLAKQSIMPLPDQGHSYQWRFNNLLDLNDFWGHTLIYLLRHFPDEKIFIWYPNVWFYLLDQKKEERFWQTLKAPENKIYTMIGHDFFLNRWAKKMFEKNNITVSLAKGPFHNKQTHYYNVVGDYVVTVVLHKVLAQEIHALFSSTRNLSEINLTDLITTFVKMKKATVNIENNPIKAQRMKTKFRRYFGIDGCVHVLE